MHLGLDLTTLITGIGIFFARVTDVSMGTMRTISIVQGRTKTAFCLGFVEVSLWLLVITTVVNQIASKPVLGIFYAVGFSTGNVVGILLERRLAFGHIIMRIITVCNGREMAEALRREGFGVTLFQGEGMTGPVTELFMVCERRNLKKIVSIMKTCEEDSFYITEPAGNVSKLYRPLMQQPTGWRSIVKKK